MRAVTEIYLRGWVRQQNRPRAFCLRRGMLLTPAARQYLQDQKIELLLDSEHNDSLPVEDKGVSEEDTVSYKEVTGRYISEDGTRKYARKAEYMTQLRGNVLVSKDHIRIEFRGRLDSLQSEMLLLYGRAQAISDQLAADVAELLEWARAILQAEVLENPLGPRLVFSLSFDELRAHSHAPKQFYGIGHILPGVGMDSNLLRLNRLRSGVREIELLAVKAFKDSDHPAGEDIIQALNRMSSAVYVLMLRCRSGQYGSGNFR